MGTYKKNAGNSVPLQCHLMASDDDLPRPVPIPAVAAVNVRFRHSRKSGAVETQLLVTELMEP